MDLENKHITIFIADRQQNVVDEIRRLLSSESGVAIVGAASTSSLAIQRTRQLAPDILLLDHTLQQSVEYESTYRLEDGNSRMRVVVMLPAYEKANIVDAFRRGAHGIVLKTSNARGFLQSLRGVLMFGYWLGDDNLGVIVEALRESLSQRNGARTATDYGLTPREMDIIAKITGGRSNREVGVEFRISERTVKHHLTNIFAKLGVSSRLQLALFAVNHHLTTGVEASLILQSAEADGDT
jgi:DNA-binding NarL/FixJ family response regulator